MCPDLDARYADERLTRYDRLAADGILRRDGAVVEVAREARNLVRVAAATFDAYRAGSTAIHSRAV